jgi:hypothetical protein
LQQGSNARLMVTCRPIGEADLPGITRLLYGGFPTRGVRYWSNGLQRLAANRPAPGIVQFGYMLEAGGVPVGVLLLISSPLTPDTVVRCNLSSWYVTPEFRAYASLLVARAIRNTSVTYVNVSPADHTIPIISAQGFTRFNAGAFAAPVSVAADMNGTRLAWLPRHWAEIATIPPGAMQLLTDHHQFGCLCLWLQDAAGGLPFIFRRRFVTWARIPSAQLIYCPTLEDLERHAGCIGRFLALRGMPLLIVPTDRSLRGVAGRLFPAKLPMYIRGPQPGRASDLTYTEAAIFGF